MPFKHINDDGTEVEAYSKEELDAVSEKANALEKEKADLEVKFAEQNQNFYNLRNANKKLSEMTEEEKKKLSVVEQQLLQNQEEFANQRKKDLDASKEALFTSVAGNNPKMLEKLKEKYGLVQMPEGSVEEIKAKLSQVVPWAKAELGITETRPIETIILAPGQNPVITPMDEGKSFADTPEAKVAETALFGREISSENK